MPRRRKSPPHAARLTGIIIRINHREGFGFIQADNGDPDYFVNIAAMRRRADWRENQPVSFVPGKPRSRPYATPALDVAAIESSPNSLPSAADLDAVAEEEKIRNATVGGA